MLKPFFCIGFAIACSTSLMLPAIARPIPSFQAESTSRVNRVNTNAPLCYIQFQGSSAIDVSKVCGKSGAAPNSTPVSVSNAAAPPVFNPRVMNASTTGQCNFVDANGNPCPQK